MKSAAILKERLRRKQLTLGIIITNHLWLELLEVSKFAGVDYVIIDQEHVQHGDELVTDACRIGRMIDFPVLVRPARTDSEAIRLTIDTGCCGLLLPMINNAAQLDEVRRGLLMPPRGERRPGGHGNWWPADFNYASWKQTVEDDVIVLAQIESPEGVANAASIAAHELTTALAVGPYDLSLRLGVCWEPDHPKLQSALTSIKAAADGAGKPMWTIGDAQKLRDAGHYFLCIAEPMYLLRATLKGMVDKLRDGAEVTGEQAFVP